MNQPDTKTTKKAISNKPKPKKFTMLNTRLSNPIWIGIFGSIDSAIRITVLVLTWDVLYQEQQSNPSKQCKNVLSLDNGLLKLNEFFSLSVLALGIIGGLRRSKKLINWFSLAMSTNLMIQLSFLVSASLQIVLTACSFLTFGTKAQQAVVFILVGALFIFCYFFSWFALISRIEDSMLSRAVGGNERILDGVRTQSVLVRSGEVRYKRIGYETIEELFCNQKSVLHRDSWLPNFFGADSTGGRRTVVDLEQTPVYEESYDQSFRGRSQK